MTPRLDLHVHSDRSDGRHPPAEVLARAAAGGIDVLALTDHDLAPALPSGAHRVGGRVVRVLAAAEVSGAHEDRELHLLAYFPGAMPAGFAAFLTERAAARAVRYDTAVARLDLPLPRAGADAHAGTRALTRHHLARALVDAGHAATLREAFTLLSARHAVPAIELRFVDAIRRVRAAGGLAVWAHPSLADAQRWVRELATAGLQGIEGVRPSMDRPTRNGLRRLAKQHGLLLTGGSDWHGWWPGALGDFALTEEHAARFLAALDAVAA